MKNKRGEVTPQAIIVIIILAILAIPSVILSHFHESPGFEKWADIYEKFIFGLIVLTIIGVIIYKIKEASYYSGASFWEQIKEIISPYISFSSYYVVENRIFLIALVPLCLSFWGLAIYFSIVCLDIFPIIDTILFSLFLIGTYLIFCHFHPFITAILEFFSVALAIVLITFIHHNTPLAKRNLSQYADRILKEDLNQLNNQTEYTINGLKIYNGGKVVFRVLDFYGGAYGKITRSGSQVEIKMENGKYCLVKEKNKEEYQFLDSCK